MSNFWHVAVDIRGSALLCAAKKSHYQFNMFVCVSNNHVDAVDRLFISSGQLGHGSRCLLIEINGLFDLRNKGVGR